MLSKIEKHYFDNKKPKALDDGQSLFMLVSDKLFFNGEKQTGPIEQER